MSRPHFVRLLLLPSSLSGITALLTAFIALISSGIVYVTENQLFYDFLFGAQGINTALLQTPSNIAALWNVVMTSSFTYYALLILVAVLSGLTIFAILHGITRITDSVHSFTEARVEQKAAIQEIFQRLAIRTAAFMATAAYWIFFINVFVPFDILLLQTGIDSFDTGTPAVGILYIAAAYTLLVISLHLHVVFARLCLLRLRLLGGYDVQMAAIDE